MTHEAIVERALGFVAEFQGDPRCALNCPHAEALAAEVHRLRADVAMWTDAYRAARHVAVTMEEERDKAEVEATHAESARDALRQQLERLAQRWEREAGGYDGSGRDVDQVHRKVLSGAIRSLRALLAAPQVPTDPQFAGRSDEPTSCISPPVPGADAGLLTASGNSAVSAKAAISPTGAAGMRWCLGFLWACPWRLEWARAFEYWDRFQLGPVYLLRYRTP